MSATKSKQVKITPAKGRPMLTWVGKRPLSQVASFPAQLVERHDALCLLNVEHLGEGSYEERLAILRAIRARWNADCWKDQPSIGIACPEQGGLVFHGDNKDVLAYLLANGYRGSVNLIYIDPPFDSGADYVRKITLRGQNGAAKLPGESESIGEQIQYTDIWANDNYLQFMYERLLLMRELISDPGYLVLHCDWKKVHHLRMLLDEVFGSEGFRNEIHWYFYNKMHDDRKAILPRATNTLLVYAKGEGATFHRVAAPRNEAVRQLKRVKVDGVLMNLKDESGNLVYQESDAKTLDNVWPIPLIPPADVRQKTDYPTQKPQALLELLMHTYTNPGDCVLDCFAGSGTTAVVAQRLGRRWIGCDINKGAIQTTIKRLRSTLGDQLAEALERSTKRTQSKLIETAEDETAKPAQFGFHVWRVNDYDLAIQHNEAVNLACEHIGVERSRGDGYFDGTLGKALVKVTPFGHPLTPLDLEELKRELDARPDEDRPIVVVCLGIELAARAWVDEWNRLRKGGDAVNKIEVIELRTDPKYGRFLRHEPADARIKLSRKKKKLVIEITDFISPAIVERLRDQAGLLAPKIDDWRAMVDCVAIDPAYNGAIFNAALMDVPERKSDFVEGRYELPAPDGETTVAVKITDMLGEEVLKVQTI